MVNSQRTYTIRKRTHYVQFGSFHPHKTLTNIPFSLARWILIFVSDENVRNTRYEELKQWLMRKKYRTGVIDSGIERARRLDREAILSEIRIQIWNLKHQRQQSHSFLRIIVLILTFSTQ